MKPSQPDDAGSPSPGKPSRPRQQPVPPGVVYALDCLERANPAQVRRHMIALGYTPDEAAESVRTALAHRDSDTPSAWGPEDAGARQCMSLGFLLLTCGIITGFLRMFFQPELPAGIPVMLQVFAWGSILAGLVVFCLGIAQMNIRRR
jgi:hypothetical protein